MMSQLTLAATVVAVLVADGAALTLGHGVADAELVGVAVVVPVLVGVAVAVPAVVGVAVGDAVLPVPWWPWPWFAAVAGSTNATGEAQLASADSLMWMVEPLLKATIAPTTTASATGMAMMTAVRRLARPSCRRRHEDRYLLGMQSPPCRRDVLFFVAGCSVTSS
jgi:hypothetical protein